jgi:hypothetical protein
MCLPRFLSVKHIITLRKHLSNKLQRFKDCFSSLSFNVIKYVFVSFTPTNNKLDRFVLPDT